MRHEIVSKQFQPIRAASVIKILNIFFCPTR